MSTAAHRASPEAVRQSRREGGVGTPRASDLLYRGVPLKQATSVYRPSLNARPRCSRMVPITSDGRSRTLLPSFHGSNMTLFGSAASQSRNKASAFFVAANVDGRKLGAPATGITRTFACVSPFSAFPLQQRLAPRAVRDQRLS